MKTLVIHPTDNTTDFLCEIYKGKGFTVIRHNPRKKDLKEQLKNHQKIILLGHGTEKGLIGHNKYIIDSSLVYILREKQCICIWCNADEFVKKYKLKGFYTGMIVSEIDEAYMYGLPTDLSLITQSNEKLAKALGKTFDIDKVKELYTPTNPVEQFNWERLYSNEGVS